MTGKVGSQDGYALPASDFNLSGTVHTNAGTYPADAWTFHDPSGNYQDASGTVNDSIGQADATVQVSGYSGGTYDSSAHTQSVTVTGVGSDGTLFSDSLSGTNAASYSKPWSFSNGNYKASDESGTLAFTIAKANASVLVTPYSVTYDSNPHSATYSITGVGSDTSAAGGSITLNSTHTSAGSYSDSWSFSGGQNYNDIATTPLSDVIGKRDLYVTAVDNTKSFGQTATDMGSVTGVQGNDGITASFSSPGDVASASVGTYTITGTLSDPNATVGNYTVHRTDATLTVVNLASGSAYILNPTASGAVTASGNAVLTLKNGLYVDSSSTSAILASGNAQVNVGNYVYHVGGVSKNGTAAVGTLMPWSVSSDPLAGLTAPSLTDTYGNPLHNYGAVSVSGKSTATLQPGIYTSIQISGQAVVTMAPGTYIIKGGGLAVTGGASVTGNGVFIFNAGSLYDGANDPTTGTFGGITLSGSGNFNLSPMSTGQYAGILIYQSRVNTRALNITGNATTSVNGTIYAANAMLNISGNGTLNDTLVVNTLNVSGNATLTQMASGSDGAGDNVGIADTLLAGNLNLYVDNSNGYFTADMLARIQDAITGIDNLLLPYNVSITEVSDPSLANVIVDASTTSASGDMAHGVLGCYNPTISPIEITMLEGWNWYAGADASQIAANQYDFQTTVTHEFGHALGLGGATSLTSPMNETLPTGTARRDMTTPDLNIPYPPEGADPQMAAGFTSRELDEVATVTPVKHESAPVAPAAQDARAFLFRADVNLLADQTTPLPAMHANVADAKVAALLPVMVRANGGELTGHKVTADRGPSWMTAETGSAAPSLEMTSDGLFAAFAQGTETQQSGLESERPVHFPATSAAVPGALDNDSLATSLLASPVRDASGAHESALADACFASADWAPRAAHVAENSLLAAVLAISPAVLREWASGSDDRDEEEQPGLSECGV